MGSVYQILLHVIAFNSLHFIRYICTCSYFLLCLHPCCIFHWERHGSSFSAL